MPGAHRISITTHARSHPVDVAGLVGFSEATFLALLSSDIGRRYPTAMSSHTALTNTAFAALLSRH